MKKFLNWFRQEESGQGMVEYALIIALIAIVVVAALVVLGPKIANLFTQTGDELDKAVSGGAITVTTQVAQN